MAGSDESTTPGDHNRMAGAPEPTLPLPASPWSRPDPDWVAPADQVPAQWSTDQFGQSPYGTPTYGQRGYGQQGDGYGQHRDGTPTYGQQSFGAPAYGQQSFGAPTYGQPSGNQGYAQSGAGQAPPQYPAGYHTGAPWPPPTPVQAPRRRRGGALLALLVAFVLVAGGTALAARSILGAEQPSSAPTLPQIVPSTPVEQPGGTQPQPSQAGPNTGTAAARVSAAQSAGVVLIEAQSASGTGAGTGMLLTADGRVLTNYHVVAGSEKLAVTIADSGDTYSARVLGFDQAKDVALLQLENAGGLATVTTDTVVPAVGSKVAAVGNAEGGGELIKAAGTVTDTDQDLTVSSESPWGNTEDLSGLIQTDARAVPGDSGGPMFDSDDEVIGMTTAGSTRARTSYAVPIETALRVVQQIDSGHDAGSTRVGPAGYLGIKVADDEQAGTGRTITEVVAGSPAKKAGMTAGSRLTRVNDTTIGATTNLATVIRALEPGAQVRVEWTTSSGNRRTATVILGSSPVA